MYPASSYSDLYPLRGAFQPTTIIRLASQSTPNINIDNIIKNNTNTSIYLCRCILSEYQYTTQHNNIIYEPIIILMFTIMTFTETRYQENALITRCELQL